MKQIFYLLVFSLISFSYLGKVTDFSGTWNLNMEKKSTAVWSADEKSLIVSSKILMQEGGELKITETYQTEENNLKITVSASSSYGDVTETYLFDKQ